jgi:sulfotransferase family protein
MPKRLAMWSGPRNISTALMRSFDALPRSLVCDEPLYAYYLAQTGLQHPHADQIIATQESELDRVIAELVGPVPPGVELYYQKHMAHHLLPQVDRTWLGHLENAFLIREPREMLTSLIEILGTIRIEDTGLPQQVELFHWQWQRTGRLPAVLDAKELLLDPATILRQFCQQVGIEFDPCMLEWPAGPRETDGCWGPYWYGNTLQSTGFGPYRRKDLPVPEQYESLALECEALYQQLAVHRIQPPSPNS